MKCPMCDKVDLTGKQTYCSPTCRKKAQRSEPRTIQAPPVMTAPAVPESPGAWLARRIKETGSEKWVWIKTGNPPGYPRIKVPQKWELDDIDQSMLFRSQWMQKKEGKTSS